MKKVILFTFLMAICFLPIISKAQQTLPDGSTAPDFTLVDINGNTQNLYSYLNAGKVVFVDFFAVWCNPCWDYHTSGELKTFYNEYGPLGSNLAMVLSVEGDGSSLSSIQGATNSKDWTAGTPYPIIGTYLPNGETISSSFQITYFPTMYMICPDKKVTAVTGYTSAQLYAKMMQKCPPVLASLDIGVRTISTPNGIVCSTTMSPVVTVRNWGSATITSCTVNYKIDAGTIQTYSWTGSITSGATANIAIPNINVTAGSHTFTAYTSNPNGGIDANLLNNQSISSFNVITVATSLPIDEGFESSTSLPVNWSLYNPDNDCAWKISTSIAHAGTKSVGFNNCDGNGSGDMTGKKDKLITTSYNFSNIINPTLSFDVAYTYLSYSGIYADTLVIYSSIDCGITWNQIYRKGGSLLATAPMWTQQNCWQPTSTQWRKDEMSLSSLSGQPKVMFAFENRSQWACWVYLDNISIQGINNINTVNNNIFFNLYPNPASDHISISALFTDKENVEGVIYDILGNAVYVFSEEAIIGNYKKLINLAAIPNGMYFISINTNKGSATNKFIKN